MLSMRPHRVSHLISLECVAEGCGRTISNVALLDLLQYIRPDASVDFLVLCEVLWFEFDDLSEATSCL
jgi:hypothetical protein